MVKEAHPAGARDSTQERGTAAEQPWGCVQDLGTVYLKSRGASSLAWLAEEGEECENREGGYREAHQLMTLVGIWHSWAVH
jgi:hypothetical protein